MPSRFPCHSLCSPRPANTARLDPGSDGRKTPPSGDASMCDGIDVVTAVDGEVAPGFERVREAFGRNFEHDGDVGAAVCVYRHGRKVADLWGGVADNGTGREWTRDTDRKSTRLNSSHPSISYAVFCLKKKKKQKKDYQIHE